MTPQVAVSTSSATAPFADSATTLLRQHGIHVLTFSADGAGGIALEAAISSGRVRGVLDITTTELAASLVGIGPSAGPDRLTAAALRGIPQVISLGGLDAVCCDFAGAPPERFKDRWFHVAGPRLAYLRTTPAENDRLGCEIAQKASAAHGPTAILIPRKGLSIFDCEGAPFWWPAADEALFQSLRNWAAPQVKLVELDLHVFDPGFADAAVACLLGMMSHPS
jgi:uncharacterized protein (UPF0261 family)